jgi:hypothetical protein
MGMGMGMGMGKKIAWRKASESEKSLNLGCTWGAEGVPRPNCINPVEWVSKTGAEDGLARCAVHKPRKRKT